MDTSLTPEQRADLLIGAMTLDQKLQQLYNEPVYNEDLDVDGDPESDPRTRLDCDFTPVGRHIEGIPELAIPDFRMANGGTGIRGGDCVPEPIATALPAQVASAATFDRDINYRWGQLLDVELRAWAHHVLWGPGMNLIRTPYGGRNHEYFSEDPYLTGVMSSQIISGVQERGVSHATAKHFVANEFDISGADGTVSSDGDFDVLPPGEESVDIGTWIEIQPTITVPADATPGDHPGGIVAGVSRGTGTAEGPRVGFNTRVGVRIHLRVTGEIEPAVTISALESTYDASWNPFVPGSVHTRYTVTNTGNVRVGSSQQADIAGLFGIPTGAETGPGAWSVSSGRSCRARARRSMWLPRGSGRSAACRPRSWPRSSPSARTPSFSRRP